MNKYISVAAAVAIAFGVMPKAHAADNSTFFANVEFGSAHVKASADQPYYGPSSTTPLYSVKGNKTSTAVRIGWRKGVIGFEEGYIDLGSQSFNVSATNNNPEFNIKNSLKGFTSGVNLHFDIRTKFYVEGRGGVFIGKQGITLSAVGVPGPSSESFGNTSLGWYAGLGGGYNFDQNWSVGVNWTHYKLDSNNYPLRFSNKADVYGASVEYRF